MPKSSGAASRIKTPDVNSNVLIGASSLSLVNSTTSL
jgi:hypothetical protein